MVFDAAAVCSIAETAAREGGDPFMLKGGLWLVCLFEGRCSVTGASGGPLLLREGDLLLAAASVVISPTVPCRASGVRLAGSAAESITRRLRGPVVGSSARCPGAAEAVELAAGGKTVLTPSFGFDLLCRAALLDEERGPAPLPRLAAEASALIRANYAGLFGVQELSDALGVSKSHLVRSFREATGVTPGRYLTLVRIEAAKQLLRDTDGPLSLVASLSGFSNANYLCRVFRAETGMPPAVWRRKARGSGVPAEQTLPMDRYFV